MNKELIEKLQYEIDKHEHLMNIKKDELTKLLQKGKFVSYCGRCCYIKCKTSNNLCHCVQLKQKCNDECSHLHECPF